MSFGYDLVLSDLDGKDDNGLVSEIDNWYKRDTERRNERAINWSQSVNFLMGNQWIQYNAHHHRFDTIPTTSRNRMIDRPTTNHVNRWVRTNSASFTQKPITSIEPNSGEPKDRTAAKLAEIVSKYLYEDQDKDDQYYELSLWAIVAGITIRKSMKVSSEFEIEGTTLRKCDSTVVSPYNIVFDGLPSRVRDISVIMETTVTRLEEIKKRFGTHMAGEAGYTGRGEDVKEEKLQQNTLSLREGLKHIVEGYNYMQRTHEQGDQIKDSAILKEIYVRPTKKYQRGRQYIVAGTEVLYKGDSDYYYDDGNIWSPYTIVNYWKVPGNIWGMGLVQQLIPIQRRINSIDALLAYNRKTVGVGTWLSPKGANVPEGSRIGVPGQEIEYTPDPATGAKPELVPGMPLPRQIIEERVMIIQDGDQIAQSGDIRSGINPRGVKTVGQLQILTEQSEMSRSKQIESWERFIENNEKLDILNFQDVYQAPIPQVYNRLKKLGNDLSEFDWKQFTGSDLRDNTDIRVERGSTLIKSRLVVQENAMKLATGGFLGDIFSNPTRYKRFLELYGLSDMYGEQEIDVIMAEKIVERMLEGEYPATLEVYNPDIHLGVIARYMKSPAFIEKDAKIRNLFDKRFKELTKELSRFPVQENYDNPEAAIKQEEEQQQELEQEALTTAPP